VCEPDENNLFVKSDLSHAKRARFFRKTIVNLQDFLLLDLQDLKD